MSESKKGMWAVLVIIVLVVGAGIFFVWANSTATTQQAATGDVQRIQAKFTCDASKSIDAVFINATSATTTGNSVQLALSDGRQLTLPQAIAADGARYANSNESFVFWDKGNGSFVMENGTTTYSNCIAAPAQQ